MANLKLSIKEQILLDGTERGTEYRYTIPNITSIDNRILTLASGSETEIFTFSNANNAGTFITSSFKYGRITNYSNTGIKLKVSSSTEALNFNLAASGSFMLNSSEITGSNNTGSFVYDDIVSIKLEPSGSNAKVEYFVATT